LGAEIRDDYTGGTIFSQKAQFERNPRDNKSGGDMESFWTDLEKVIYGDQAAISLNKILIWGAGRAHGEMAESIPFSAKLLMIF
jgi:hypothetical protein